MKFRAKHYVVLRLCLLAIAAASLLRYGRCQEGSLFPLDVSEGGKFGWTLVTSTTTPTYRLQGTWISLFYRRGSINLPSPSSSTRTQLLLLIVQILPDFLCLVWSIYNAGPSELLLDSRWEPFKLIGRFWLRMHSSRLGCCSLSGQSWSNCMFKSRCPSGCGVFEWLLMLSNRELVCDLILRYGWSEDILDNASLNLVLQVIQVVSRAYYVSLIPPSSLLSFHLLNRLRQGVLPFVLPEWGNLQLARWYVLDSFRIWNSLVNWVICSSGGLVLGLLFRDTLNLRSQLAVYGRRLHFIKVKSKLPSFEEERQRLFRLFSLVLLRRTIRPFVNRWWLSTTGPVLRSLLPLLTPRSSVDLSRLYNKAVIESASYLLLVLLLRNLKQVALVWVKLWCIGCLDAIMHPIEKLFPLCVRSKTLLTSLL